MIAVKQAQEISPLAMTCHMTPFVALQSTPITNSRSNKSLLGETRKYFGKGFAGRGGGGKRTRNGVTAAGNSAGINHQHSETWSARVLTEPGWCAIGLSRSIRYGEGQIAPGQNSKGGKDASFQEYQVGN